MSKYFQVKFKISSSKSAEVLKVKILIIVDALTCEKHLNAAGPDAATSNCLTTSCVMSTTIDFI